MTVTWSISKPNMAKFSQKLWFVSVQASFFNMPDNQRVLRSTLAKTASTVLPPRVLPIYSSSSSSHSVIRMVAPGATLPGLDSTELSLLRKKQRQLQSNASATLSSLLWRKHLRTALEACLIFAQHEAGTAVCIDAAGWVLTCSHCFGEIEEEWRAKKRKWLLFYTGLAVQVECRAWDSTRDLALLKIIAIESGASQKTANPVFSFVSLSSSAPSLKTLIVCVGQPGSDDLESTSDRRTNYKLIEVSEGKFCGMVPGADPDNNSVIGSLKHDAWTYWGPFRSTASQGTGWHIDRTSFIMGRQDRYEAWGPTYCNQAFSATASRRRYGSAKFGKCNSCRSKFLTKAHDEGDRLRRCTGFFAKKAEEMHG